MAFDGYHLHGTVVDVQERSFTSFGGIDQMKHTRSVTAWIIEEGEVAGIPVGGSVLVTICQPFRDLDSDSVERLILVEEEAAPDVVRWMVDAFHGRLGGPLAEIARGVSKERGFYQVPIQHSLGMLCCDLKVPGRLDVSASGGPISSDHPAAFRGPWTADWIGEAEEMAVAVPEHRMAWSGRGSRVLRGDFTFTT